MRLSDSHPGERGKTIVEKIQDELDTAVEYHDGKQTEGSAWFAEGIAHALGILRGTDGDTEVDRSRQRLDGTAQEAIALDPMHDPWRNR